MKAALIILDGFGFTEVERGNAIKAAKTPVLDQLFSTYPHSLLRACGPDVGLPEGQMGNSEVGHLNIGAGRIVYQALLRITKEMEDGSFFKRKVVEEAFSGVLGGKLHFLGLLSPGGVHSHSSHLKSMLLEAKRRGIKDCYVHVFLDGRDTAPDSGLEDVKDLEAFMKEEGVGKIATVSGRYYAMDRDKRWERVEKAYRALVYGEGEFLSPTVGIEKSYKEGVFDEFVLPFVSDPKGSIASGDTVIFYNFRPDRARELTEALTQDSFTGFSHKKMHLRYYCMSQYSSAFTGLGVIYPPETLEETLGEYLSEQGKTQYRSAETEKYPHVTFFFNGGREEAFPGEERVLIPSPKVATYDLQPEMSAYEVTDALVEAIEKKKFDFYLVNYANADMVGHTGNYEAAVRAIEALDQCLGRVTAALKEKGIPFIITADHGNADEMILPSTGAVSTQHSLNPVPFLLGGMGDVPLRKEGRLCDLAPTILKMMQLEIPAAMTGEPMF